MWLDEFVEGCFSYASRFEKQTKKRKVQNFASAAVESKVINKDLMLVELQITRDLADRLLYLITLENVDLENVFQVFVDPSSSIPISFCWNPQQNRQGQVAA